MSAVLSLAAQGWVTWLTTHSKPILAEAIGVFGGTAPLTFPLTQLEPERALILAALKEIQTLEGG